MAHNGLFRTQFSIEMTYEEILSHLYTQFPVYQQIGGRAMKVGLGNSERLCTALGNPQKAYRTIHVAGTNGKGSTCHSLAAVLQSCGYKVGLYTSPHLVDFRERIRIDGEMISKQEVIDFVEQNDALLREVSPSFFETTMVMAFDAFRRHKVDVAVIEVGLGGRLDSTNIIEPDACVITNIGFDHMQFLGNTLPEIASEKAGIIKPHTPVVIGEHAAETDRVFIDAAKRANAPIYFAEDCRSVAASHVANDMLELSLKNSNGELEDVKFSLTGLCQQHNILTILTTIDILRSIGYRLPQPRVDYALQNVQQMTGLMGRWQKIATKPDTVVDTGHNAHGIRLVAKQLSEANYDHIHIVWGMVSDKHPETVLPLLPKNAKYYFCRPNIERGLPLETLAEEAKKAGLTGKTYPTVAEAVNSARAAASANDLIFIGGSNFVVAEVI